jgi:flagellar hook-associated protein 1
MADILSIGVSGLKAFQRALDVTSHNIANASTPGYARQRVELATRVAQGYGSSYIGSGVDINSITRSYDELLASQSRTASSSFSRLDTYASNAQSLNRLFADSSTGLSASMQKFMNAVQGVSNEPTSTAARQVLLSEAEGLKQRLQTYDQRLGSIESELNARLTGEASAVSLAADNIARLNQQIVSAQASGQAPNDLLNARDQAIDELSTHLTVSVVKQSDGALNVFVGNGQSLVLGEIAAKFVAQRDAFDPGKLTVAYQTAGSSIDLATSISGGSLGGLLDFRRELLDPTRNQLGQIATGLVDVSNAQHHEGMDLYGSLGGDLFTLGKVQVLPASANSGGGTISVTRSGIGALTSHDYILQFDGSNWSARQADGGTAVALTGAGTAASPFVADGLSIVVGGAAAVGDRFLIKPTAGAVAGLAVAIADPSRIAAAAPIRSSAAPANTGNAVITSGEVLDAGNAQLRSTATLAFIDASHYSINGAGSFSYSPGANIDANGWRVSISGTAKAGDVFTVENNAGGVGDNRNALELSNLLGKGVLAGGTESLNSAVTRFVGAIGVATNRAQAGAEAQKIILNDAQKSIDSTSGVNLDEEAADMIRYQQAYQAAAQVIRVTQTLFDSLLAATSR